jgi:hypothetical protein
MLDGVAVSSAGDMAKGRREKSETHEFDRKVGESIQLKRLVGLWCGHDIAAFLTRSEFFALEKVLVRFRDWIVTIVSHNEGFLV